MNVCFVNLNFVVQANDKFTTGIIYMPIGLSYILGYFKSKNVNYQLIDLFGNNPDSIHISGKFILLGDNPNTIESKLNSNTKIVFIFANHLINHISLSKVVKSIKLSKFDIKICVIENTQAVTAYAIKPIKNELFDLGVDYLISGYGEKSAYELYQKISNNISLSDSDEIRGLITKNYENKNSFNENLDEMPFPDWSKFNLKAYWKLNHAHGPLSSKKYLPILTSRGCPYPCKFCVVPYTNDRKWNSRSAENVIQEIKHLKNTYGVSEFHLEDLNPTVNDRRTKEFCKKIINEKINIKWKIVAGTKVESIRDEETVRLMALAGCKYVSISPETGSPRLLELIDKPFKIDHAINVIRYMNKYKIKSQACFVIGFPGENDDDLLKTENMIKKITKIGIDEIAVFIISPVPGSNIFDKLSGYSQLSDLNFTPTWRDDYKKLSKVRIKFYAIFLLYKIIFHPIKVLIQVKNFFSKNFETKMEMVPFKALKYALNQLRNNTKY